MVVDKRYESTEVLRVDRSSVFGSGLGHQSDPVGHHCRRCERRQPTVTQTPATPQFGWSLTTQPNLERVLDGLGVHPDPLEVEAVAAVVHLLLGPESTDQGKGLVAPGRPVATPNAERLVLGAISDSQSEGR